MSTFTSIPGTRLATPGNIVPGAGAFSATNGAVTFTVNRWQGGVGTGWPYESTGYITVAVTAEYEDGTAFDPTVDVVQFAFIGLYATTQQAADYPPTSATVWTNGEWDPNATSTATILIGQDNDALTLAVGSYQVWMRVIDSPEVPVLWCGPMIVS